MQCVVENPNRLSKTGAGLGTDDDNNNNKTTIFIYIEFKGPFN